MQWDSDSINAIASFESKLKSVRNVAPEAIG